MSTLVITITFNSQRVFSGLQLLEFVNHTLVSKNEHVSQLRVCGFVRFSALPGVFEYPAWLSTSWAPVHHLLLISSSRAQQEPWRLHSSPPDCCASAPRWCALSWPLSVTHRHLSPLPVSLWLSVLCLPPIRFSHRLISPPSTLWDLHRGMAQGWVFSCQSPLICSPTPSLSLFHSYHHM